MRSNRSNLREEVRLMTISDLWGLNEYPKDYIVDPDMINEANQVSAIDLCTFFEKQNPQYPLNNLSRRHMEI